MDEWQEIIDDDPKMAGWEMVSEVSISCADHGYTIELDGECPEGCVSALVQMGMI